MDLSQVVHSSRPLEQKDSALASVTCISEFGEEKNRPNFGAGAELLVLSTAAVKQVSAARAWCSCGHVHSGGGICRFSPVRVVLSAAGLCIIRARIRVLMNQQWLRKQNFVEELLPSSNCGKEPLKILEKPGGSSFFPPKGVFSFTADRPAHTASTFTHQVLLLLWPAGNHVNSVHRDTCLVFLNLLAELIFYFPLGSSTVWLVAALSCSKGQSNGQGLGKSVVRDSFRATLLTVLPTVTRSL